MFSYSKQISILLIVVAVVIAAAGIYLNFIYEKPEEANTADASIPENGTENIKGRPNADTGEYKTKKAVANAIEYLKQGNYTEYNKSFSDKKEEVKIIEDSNIVKLCQLVLGQMEYSIVSEEVNEKMARIEVEVKKIDMNKLLNMSGVKSVIDSNIDATIKLKDILEKNKSIIEENMITETYNLRLVNQSEEWKIEDAIDFLDVFVFEFNYLERRNIEIYKKISENEPRTTAENSKKREVNELDMLFNKIWEAYIGDQTGNNIKDIILKLTTYGNAFKEYAEKLLTVEYIIDDETKIIYGGETAVNDIEKYVGEIQTLTEGIDNKRVYQVRIEYSNDKLVNKIIIEY